MCLCLIQCESTNFIKPNAPFRHNDDGSYTYGFEGADGTFKIETKFANGDVKGKYGFVDDTGKVRTVEYGADKYGFQPAGEGITVAPPTLVDESLTEEYPSEQQQYRPQAPKPKKQKPRPQQPAPVQQYAPAPVQYSAPAPAPAPQQYRPAPAPQQYRAAPAPAAPAPQYQVSGASYEQQINYAQPGQYQVVEQQEPSRNAAPAPPRRIQVAGAAPVPPRAEIPGAAPARRINAAPAPQAARAGPSAPQQYRPQAAAPTPPRRVQVAGAAPVAQPQQYFQPAPQYQAAPSAPQQPIHYQPAPVAAARSPQPQKARAYPTGSILDQLAKDYALPQGGSPLHDITFSGF